MAQSASVRPGRAVVQALRERPHGYEWPELNDMADAFETGRYYGAGGINQDRLRLLLGAVDRLLQEEAPKSEMMSIEYESLQIEHVIPRSWRQRWPVRAEDPNARLLDEQRREQHVNRIGNLTLVTGSLNPAMSNNPWEAKRAELRKHSKLQLNALLVEEDHWNEHRIAKRGRWLARQVDKVWPGPTSRVWDRTV